MSDDIYNVHITDFDIESDDTVPLKPAKLSDAAFDYLYMTLDSEGHSGDGHFFVLAAGMVR